MLPLSPPRPKRDDYGDELDGMAMADAGKADIRENGPIVRPARVSAPTPPPKPLTVADLTCLVQHYERQAFLWCEYEAHAMNDGDDESVLRYRTVIDDCNRLADQHRQAIAILEA
tara:strand:- start:311 stop:655 length:345 start_codon:yes stop_codon:yes gene_type:complete